MNPVSTLSVLAAPRVARVPLERCVSYLGFSFADGGFHPLRAAAEDLLAGMDTEDYPESRLARFYAAFQPTTLARALLLSSREAPHMAARDVRAAIHVYPWSSSVRRLASGECQHFGPALRDGPRHFARQAALLASIRDRGYRPRRLLPSGVRGVWLKRHGEARFLLLGGQHRAGVLAALGHHSLAARVDGTVDLAEAGDWALVRQGAMGRDEAERVFMRYFELDGRERAPAGNSRASAGVGQGHLAPSS